MWNWTLTDCSLIYSIYIIQYCHLKYFEVINRWIWHLCIFTWSTKLFIFYKKFPLEIFIISTKNFTMLQNLTCIAFGGVLADVIFVICWHFSRGQKRLFCFCWKYFFVLWIYCLISLLWFDLVKHIDQCFPTFSRWGSTWNNIDRKTLIFRSKFYFLQEKLWILPFYRAL